MLSGEELIDLEDRIYEELKDRLPNVLSKLNRSDQLEDLLSLLDMTDLLQMNPAYPVYKRVGKIIVIGQTNVKQNALLGVAKELGLGTDRFEFYLEYEDAKKFDFHKMQWQPERYSAIMVGPMPHSGYAKGDYSSVIVALENENGYPPVIRLGSKGLKITKSDFKKSLQEMLEKKIILPE